MKIADEAINSYQDGTMQSNATPHIMTIRQASNFTGVPCYTLRYWEKEFPDFLHPLRTRGRQRRYDENALRAVYRLKDLIHTQRYSLAGARKELAAVQHKEETGTNSRPPVQSEEKLHEVLEEIREILQEKLLGGRDGEALMDRDNVGANS